MKEPHLSNSGLLTLNEALYLSWASPRFAYSNLTDKLISKKQISFPRFLVLHLTDNCNFACPMCSIAKVRKLHLKAGFKQMPIEFINKLAKEARPYGAMVNLYGGEPLLYHHLDETLSILKQNNLISYLTTNGLLVEKKVDVLISNGLHIIQISLDGWDENSQYKRGYVADSFETITKGIEKLRIKKGKKTFPIMRIATTVTQNNFHSLDRIQQTIHNLGISQWVINQYQFVTNDVLKSHEIFKKSTGVGDFIVGDRIGDKRYFSKEEVTELKATLDRVRVLQQKLNMQIYYNWNLDLERYYSFAMPTRHSSCSLPFNRADILADGSIMLCMDGFKIGSLSTETIKEAWRGEHTQRFHSMYKSLGIMPMCFRCCGIYDTMKFREFGKTGEEG
jgi:molybdenum cofactor biosynthesis enzyme MoaA